MFLRNAWYVAALAREIGRTPMSRWILGEPLVLFRAQDGTPSILTDRCPHRGAQLSAGWLEGDVLVCGYHGIGFGPDGRCVRIPGLDNPPPQANALSYPCIERWGWVFVWMGDPAQADESKLPEYHWMTEPGWAGHDDLLEVNADYTLVRDNLLDLSHAKFVHQQTLGTDAVTQYPIEASMDDGMVRVVRDMPGIQPSPFFKRLRGFEGAVNHRQLIEFTPPCNVIIKVRVSSVSPEEGKVAEMRVLNALTPERPGKTHYFWGLMRNFAIEDEEVTRTAHKLNRDTFYEDVAVLERQQIMLDSAPSSFAQLSLPADQGCVYANRIMRQMVAGETPRPSA